MDTLLFLQQLVGASHEQHRKPRAGAWVIFMIAAVQMGQMDSTRLAPLLAHWVLYVLLVGPVDPQGTTRANTTCTKTPCKPCMVCRGVRVVGRSISHPDGGQFDVVWLPARTPHGGAPYVRCLTAWRNQESYPPVQYYRPRSRAWSLVAGQALALKDCDSLAVPTTLVKQEHVAAGRLYTLGAIRMDQRHVEKEKRQWIFGVNLRWG